MRSTLPLFPTDDGWPYPDGPVSMFVAEDPDFDVLELLGPHAYDSLTAEERAALSFRFGLDGSTPLSMKELAVVLGCSRGEAGVLVGRAIDKMRVQLLQE